MPTTFDPTEIDTLESLGRPAEKPDARPQNHGNAVAAAKFLIVFVCLALVGLNAWLASLAHTREMSQISAANGNLAHSVTQQVDGTISDIDHVLGALVFQIERTSLDPESLERLQPNLVDSVATVDQLKGLFIYGADGRWLVTSEAVENLSRNNSDREYFSFHRANSSRESHLGSPIISRSSGEWIIPMSRRINDDRGNFAGIALATLQISKLKDGLEKFNVGRDGALAITLGDRLLLRIPYKESDLGRKIPDGPLLKVLSSNSSGVVAEKSPLDGILRIINFEHTPNYPVLVTVAVGKDEALQEWRSSSYILTAIITALCIFIIASGKYLIGAVRFRVEAEEDIRSARDALYAANVQLAHLARDDGLTGIANRRTFDSQLTKRFAAARRFQRPLAIVMIDVDEFKKFNELYGHLGGDDCLKKVAGALRTAVGRPEDLLARYGGEEMVLLLPETELQGAAHVAEKARQAVENLAIAHDGTNFRIVTVSLGVAAWTPVPDEAADDMLKAADVALYKAKSSGRNRICEYSREA